MAFFFTSEAKNKNFKVNIVKKDKSEFETHSISDDSDLSSMLRRGQYFRESDSRSQASWPTMICDKSGSLLLAYFHSEDE